MVWQKPLLKVGPKTGGLQAKSIVNVASFKVSQRGYYLYFIGMAAKWPKMLKKTWRPMRLAKTLVKVGPKRGVANSI